MMQIILSLMDAMTVNTLAASSVLTVKKGSAWPVAKTVGILTNIPVKRSAEMA